MPYLGSLEYAPAAGRWQLAASTTAPSGCARSGTPWSCRAGLSGQLAGLAGPVLLVDDIIDTGWTLTVAAMALRQSGAAAVLPLTLAAAGA